MQTITSYHRPTSLEDALGLLEAIGPNALIVSGGTQATTADIGAGTEVIDLQAVGLEGITIDPDRVGYGAMARLQDIVDQPVTPPLLQELARREGPNTFRNAATIGGTVATADPASELLAGLLVHEATVTIASQSGVATMAIEDLLADQTILPEAIITAVSVATGGATAAARTGRTPADTSIVAAVGRATEDGIRLALTGVATTPILVTSSEVATLTPPGDFRGSSEYRRALAVTLTGRVLAELGGAA